MNITDIFDIFFKKNNTEIRTNVSDGISDQEAFNAILGSTIPAALVVLGCIVTLIYYQRTSDKAEGFFRWFVNRGRSLFGYCRGFFFSGNNNDVEVVNNDVNEEILMHDLSSSYLQDISVKFLIDSEGNLISGQLIANGAVKKISFSKTQEKDCMYIIMSSTDSDDLQDGKDCTGYVKPAKDNENYEEKSGVISLLGDETFKLTYEVSGGEFFEIICLIGADCKAFLKQLSQSLVESEAAPLMELDQSLIR